MRAAALTSGQMIRLKKFAGAFSPKGERRPLGQLAIAPASNPALLVAGRKNRKIDVEGELKHQSDR
jgi:hypothetical protein